METITPNKIKELEERIAVLEKEIAAIKKQITPRPGDRVKQSAREGAGTGSF